MSVVVCLASEDLVCTVELLEQDHPGELVRERKWPQREAMVGRLELEPEGSPDYEAEIAPAVAPLFQKAAEGDGIKRLAVAVQQGDKGPRRQPPSDPLALAHFDQLGARVAREQLAVVLHVVGEWGAQPPHCQHDDAHDGILSAHG
jgi:hypothetical protein